MDELESRLAKIAADSTEETDVLVESAQLLDIFSKRKGRRGLSKGDMEKFRELAQDGYTASDIAEELGVSLCTVSKYKTKKNIMIVESRGRKKKKKRNDNLERLAKRGLSQVQLADRFEISYTRVQQLLKETGVYENWKQSRLYYTSAQEKHKTILEDIAGMINNVAGRLVLTMQEAVYRNSGEEQGAEKKAFEYLKKHPRSKLGFEKITALFSLYIDAEKNGDRISLSEFSGRTQIPVMTISKMFRRSGLEPMVHGRIKRHVVSKKKKEVLRRVTGAEISLSGKDISYFLKVPFWVVRDNTKRYGGKLSGGLRRRVGGRYLTYALASQIYEAIDLGFNIEETAELNDVANKMVDYALSDRVAISRDIRRELRVLYSRRKSNKPYLSSEENKNN